jgi:uncharacterized membrane protein YccC
MMRRRLSLDLPASLYFGTLAGCAFLPTDVTQRPEWAFFTFIPVGVFLLLLLGRRRWWVAIGFGALAAAWVEAAQSVWMPAGYAEASDVGWSIVGCAIGVAATLVVVRAPQRVPRAPVAEPVRRGEREMLDSSN